MSQNIYLTAIIIKASKSSYLTICCDIIELYEIKYAIESYNKGFVNYDRDYSKKVFLKPRFGCFNYNSEYLYDINKLFFNLIEMREYLTYF